MSGRYRVASCTNAVSITTLAGGCHAFSCWLLASYSVLYQFNAGRYLAFVFTRLRRGPIITEVVFALYWLSRFFVYMNYAHSIIINAQKPVLAPN